GNRIAVDRNAVVMVAALAAMRRVGRRDGDLVPCGAQPAGERRDVNLGAAPPVREKPADGLHESHALTAAQKRRAPGPRSSSRRRKRASLSHQSRSVACVGSALRSQINFVFCSVIVQPSARSQTGTVRTPTRSTAWWVLSK